MSSSSSSTTSATESLIPNESQQRIINIVMRVFPAISFAFAFHLVWTVITTKFYRERIFHRIMMGCAINIMISNVLFIWGQAAVPAGTPGYPGARGTIATCTAQGFLIHMVYLAVPYYYNALSILCLVAFRNKFQVHKYRWIEMFIHIGVYIIPLALGIYLLLHEAFNPTLSLCFYGSSPFGCGDMSDGEIECVRGPYNIGKIFQFMVGIQIGTVFLLPLILMFALSCKVSLLQGSRGRMVARSVAKQAFMYIIFLYWAYIPTFINWGFTAAKDEYVFAAHIFGIAFTGLQGLWFYIPYIYFRTDPIEKLHRAPGTSEITTTEGSGDNNNNNNNQKADNTSPATAKDNDVASPSSSTYVNRSNSLKPVFSIFDGSDAVDPESPWAKYLHDEGEDDSYHENCEYDDSQFDGI